MRKVSGTALAMAIMACASAQGQGDAKTEALRLKAWYATQNHLEVINGHASSRGVDPALVIAVITVESKGNPSAVSSSGAMGLMQLMPATCEDLGVVDPFDPDSNIGGGTALLARHLSRYKGNLQKVLAAYNAGPRRADDGSWKNLKETRRYVPQVMAYYTALRPGGNGWMPRDSNSPVSTTTPAPATNMVDPGPSMLDPMLETIRSTIPDVAEHGDLHEVAGTLAIEYTAGRMRAADAQGRAERLLRAMRLAPTSVRVSVLSTPARDGFPAIWANQPAFDGRFVGVSHVPSANGHTWVVILANK